VLGIANSEPLLGVFVFIVHGGASHAGIDEIFFLLVFSRRWQRHTYNYTKKPGLSPALSKPLLYLYFLGFMFVFSFKR